MNFNFTDSNDSTQDLDYVPKNAFLQQSTDDETVVRNLVSLELPSSSKGAENLGIDI